MSIRPATHAGSWYSGSAARLDAQLDHWLSKAAPSVAGARLLVGPHAGYSYAGETLAQTYNALDVSGIKRVFIMGPSHHVYYKHSVMTTKYDYYETPLGNVPVDRQVISELVAKDAKLFRLMSSDMDEDEHSFEMHMPFLHKVFADAGQTVPAIVPIMVSASDEPFERKLAENLEPYFQDAANAFVISTDFCHWGSRFGYTAYTPSGQLSDLQDLRASSSVAGQPIYKSIEALDKEAMRVASQTSYKAFREYLQATENTICGAKPLSVLLLLMETNSAGSFNWLGYTQSSSVTSYHDSSVSYASAYALA
ncbi:hypothetical protein OGAPHI_007098 [Ogataea philodendri]|uniref:Protein MEMO1 n=1 Tax=Ogataea philodendri TaxID=1378263 RepID=A0A9P8NVQ1_9ASCO|nr:uncharacterized protein OGAPHI_007098 [Ogataea philodendri]KAH3660512.1 hypothetical protein OGAPHI_007098 [Ogataea philodendri]